MTKKIALTKAQQLKANINRSFRDIKETFSFLDYLCNQLIGRIPHYGDDNDDIIEEVIPKGQFIGALKQFIEAVESGRLPIADIGVHGQVDTFRMLAKNYPGYQIYMTKVTQRSETDAEVLAKLKRQEAKLAKKKKAR